MKRRLFLGAAVLAPPAAFLVSLPGNDTSTRAPHYAPPGRFPNVPLTTHRGERVRFYDDVIRGNNLVVLNMMYTRCPEICGGTLVNLARVQRILGERVGQSIHLYSITLDPSHDTPAVLARYAELIGAGPGWTFLTGRRANIERLRRPLGFFDRNPVVDKDLTRHTGMVLAGNDALQRWSACPGLGRAEQLAQGILWVGMAQRG